MKAFSLVETIAVMLLSAILLLMIWKGIEFINYYTLEENRLMNTTEKENLFYYKLYKDVGRGMMFKSLQKNHFLLYHPQLKDTVYYYVEPLLVLRKEKKQIDSFFIDVKSIHLDTNFCQMRIGNQLKPIYVHELQHSSCD